MKSRKGFTLMETVIGITVIGIVFSLSLAAFVMVAPKTITLENLDKKACLAQEKIEEVLARDFGVLTSEAAAFSGDFSNYQYSMVVSYVSSLELDTPVAGPTNYKNVKVRVWGGAADSPGTVEITSLVTTYEVKP